MSSSEQIKKKSFFSIVKSRFKIGTKKKNINDNSSEASSIDSSIISQPIQTTPVNNSNVDSISKFTTDVPHSTNSSNTNSNINESVHATSFKFPSAVVGERSKPLDMSTQIPQNQIPTTIKSSKIVEKHLEINIESQKNSSDKLNESLQPALNISGNSQTSLITYNKSLVNDIFTNEICDGDNSRSDTNMLTSHARIETTGDSESQFTFDNETSSDKGIDELMDEYSNHSASEEADSNISKKSSHNTYNTDDKVQRDYASVTHESPSSQPSPNQNVQKVIKIENSGIRKSPRDEYVVEGNTFLIQNATVKSRSSEYDEYSEEVDSPHDEDVEDGDNNELFGDVEVDMEIGCDKMNSIGVRSDKIFEADIISVVEDKYVDRMSPVGITIEKIHEDDIVTDKSNEIIKFESESNITNHRSGSEENISSSGTTAESVDGDIVALAHNENDVSQSNGNKSNDLSYSSVDGVDEFTLLNITNENHMKLMDYAGKRNKILSMDKPTPWGYTSYGKTSKSAPFIVRDKSIAISEAAFFVDTLTHQVHEAKENTAHMQRIDKVVDVFASEYKQHRAQQEAAKFTSAIKSEVEDALLAFKGPLSCPRESVMVRLPSPVEEDKSNRIDYSDNSESVEDNNSELRSPQNSLSENFSESESLVGILSEVDEQGENVGDDIQDQSLLLLVDSKDITDNITDTIPNTPQEEKIEEHSSNNADTAANTNTSDAIVDKSELALITSDVSHTPTGMKNTMKRSVYGQDLSDSWEIDPDVERYFKMGGLLADMELTSRATDRDVSASIHLPTKVEEPVIDSATNMAQPFLHEDLYSDSTSLYFYLGSVYAGVSSKFPTSNRIEALDRSKRAKLIKSITS
jgi:hypothetical protein